MAVDEKTVTAELAGSPLDAAVRALFTLSWGKARAHIESGKIRVDGQLETNGLRRVREGAAVALNLAAHRHRPDDLPRENLLHLDTHLVVVEKPAGISTVPYDESESGTLDEKVRSLLARSSRGAGASRPPGRPALGVVHRIDKETSGLLVFTRTWLAKESLTAQFRAHTVHRRYLALVHGYLGDRVIMSHIMDDRGDGIRGSWERRPGARRGPPEGQRCVTHVEVLERLEGASLVACRLETGRTHQIRIHLSEEGHPLLGERVYIRGFRGPELPAPRLMLHAAELGFVHPVSEEDTRFSSEPPADFQATLARLRPGPASLTEPGHGAKLGQ